MAGQNYFSKIFGDSPVTPLQNHIDKVVSCVEQLPPYFEAVYANKWEQAAKVQKTLSNIERDADNIKNKLRMHLPSSLFMPVDRRDVLEVLDLQDNIANKAKDCQAHYIKLSVAADGKSYTVSIPASGKTETYKTK